jgi:hypothetical protein
VFCFVTHLGFSCTCFRVIVIDIVVVRELAHSHATCTKTNAPNGAAPKRVKHLGGHRDWLIPAPLCAVHQAPWEVAAASAGGSGVSGSGPIVNWMLGNSDSIATSASSSAAAGADATGAAGAGSGGPWGAAVTTSAMRLEPVRLSVRLC